MSHCHVTREKKILMGWVQTPSKHSVKSYARLLNDNRRKKLSEKVFSFQGPPIGKEFIELPHFKHLDLGKVPLF